MTLVICSPRGYTYRTIRRCPTCERRRRFVVSMWVWYPSIATCVACGDEWSEDGRQPRPFARGWRETATRQARQTWAIAMTRAEAMSALMAAVDEERAS